MTPDRAKLLIVDDSRIRKVIRSLMQGLGFNSIDEAPDGASALDLFHMGAYDLVISDWNLPQVSGLPQHALL
ncbi:MAG: response regulator [Archangium sp.]|nr:response regulator [Archangium sp.]MDP3158359.1 response regulator [Archangium sp.]MDP3569360.1 response regulator [Archangium sp.]